MTLPTKNQSGQALLIVLLIMAVSLTIGLSIISSSVTDISLSGKSDDSARAFSAAEAGIEEGLVTGGTTGVVTFSETGATYQTTSTNLGVGQTAFAFPGDFKTDQIQTFWFASYNPATGVWTKTYDRTRIRFLWGNKNSTDYPALEASIYYQDTDGSYKVGRFAFDPTTRTPPNYFCPLNLANPAYCPNILNFQLSWSADNIDGKEFQYRATINLSAASIQGAGKTLLFARLRFLYSAGAHILGVVAGNTGTGTFPSQGTIIDAVGQSGSATRKVEVKRLLSAPPSLLDYTVYSGGGLTHQ